jgi:hypothetical protein
MAFFLNIGMPFFMLRLRHIAIAVNQGVETGKVGSVLQMGAESGTGEKIIENQVIFVGVSVEQIIHGPLVSEGGQLVLVAGGIDDRPAPVVNQNRMAERVSSPADELDRPVLEIVQKNFLSRKKSPPPCPPLSEGEG